MPLRPIPNTLVSRLATLSRAFLRAEATTPRLVCTGPSAGFALYRRRPRANEESIWQAWLYRYRKHEEAPGTSVTREKSPHG